MAKKFFKSIIFVGLILIIGIVVFSMVPSVGASDSKYGMKVKAQAYEQLVSRPYYLKDGDTLWMVANNLCEEDQWRHWESTMDCLSDICKFNRIADPNTVRYGDCIYLPYYLYVGCDDEGMHG